MLAGTVYDGGIVFSTRVLSVVWAAVYFENIQRAIVVYLYNTASGITGKAVRFCAGIPGNIFPVDLYPGPWQQVALLVVNQQCKVVVIGYDFQCYIVYRAELIPDIVSPGSGHYIISRCGGDRKWFLNWISAGKGVQVFFICPALLRLDAPEYFQCLLI